MGKIMPLELLASIKGATSSDAVNELFEVIRKAVPDENMGEPQRMDHPEAVPVSGLRSDEIGESSETEREIIVKNFPAEKNGFLVVPKVIEE
jgi:Asp-tRNA(Asn)/Glu-tRNA(Gln) amidotransferase C subunit